MKYLQYQVRDRFTVTVKNKVWKHGAYRLFTNVHGSKIKKTSNWLITQATFAEWKIYYPVKKTYNLF